jgi:hypothetical protein
MCFLLNVGTKIYIVGQPPRTHSKAAKKGGKRSTRAHGSYLVFSSAIETNLLAKRKQLIERTRSFQCDTNRSKRIHCDIVRAILPWNLLELSCKDRDLT